MIVLLPYVTYNDSVYRLLPYITYNNSVYRRERVFVYKLKMVLFNLLFNFNLLEFHYLLMNLLGE